MPAEDAMLLDSDMRENLQWNLTVNLKFLLGDGVFRPRISVRMWMQASVSVTFDGCFHTVLAEAT